MKRRVVEDSSNRGGYYLQKQSSVESNSSDEVEYGPDTEFIDTCKRMFSIDKPVTTSIDKYPRSIPSLKASNRNALVPFSKKSHRSDDSFPLKLVSASLLELFLSTLPVDKRDDVRTVLVQMLTAGGFISRKVFAEQYADSRNALVNNISAYVVNIARKFLNGNLSTPRIDDVLKINGSIQFEQFLSRYEQDFEEIKEIGTGGFGRVFHSRSRVDNQHYAIKKIFLKNSEKTPKKMLDECRFHACLQHPNVVRYHNAWLEITISESPKIDVSKKVKTLSTTTTRPLVVDGWMNESKSFEKNEGHLSVVSSVSSEESKKGFWVTPQKFGNFDSPFVTFESSEEDEKSEDKDGEESRNKNEEESGGDRKGKNGEEFGDDRKGKNEEESGDDRKGKNKNEFEDDRKGKNGESGDGLEFEDFKRKKFRNKYIEKSESEDDEKEEDDYKDVEKLEFESEDEVESDLSDGSGSSLGSFSARKLAKQLVNDDDIEEVQLSRGQLALNFTRTTTTICRTLYIQMELCHFTLEKYMKNRAKNGIFDTKFNETVIEGLLSAVDFLHKNHVVHRDIKPSNIMMKVQEGKTNVLLGDFGLAREIRELTLDESPNSEDEYKWKLTSGLGTYLYAAPEQLNSKEYTVSADIFSSGVVLYEIYQIFSTGSERIHILSDLRKNKKTTDEFKKKFPKLTMGIWQERDIKPVGALHLEGATGLTVIHDPVEELICQLKQLRMKYHNLKKEVETIDELISILEEIIDMVEPFSLASIWNIARRDVPIPVNAPKELLQKKHEEFILKYGKTENLFEYVMSEHLRLSGLYWCLTALDIMGKIKEADKDLILNVIEEAKNDDGGYGAAKHHCSHILHTLSAVQVLVTLDKKELIDVDSVVKFVQNLQQDDGSFNGMPKENDNDTRFAFCALATLYLLNKLDKVDVEKTVNYVLSCYNFDGGFGTYPKSESHAGQIYCCLGVLAITNNLEKIDGNKTGRWLAERQCPSGGLCGRPEKLPDVCYSWWVLASLAILKKTHWIDKETLIQFILGSQDDELGGIADRPGDETDPFHTVFGLAGLSLLGFENLAKIDPVFCMTTRTLGNLSFATKEPKENEAEVVRCGTETVQGKIWF